MIKRKSSTIFTGLLFLVLIMPMLVASARATSDSYAFHYTSDTASWYMQVYYNDLYDSQDLRVVFNMGPSDFYDRVLVTGIDFKYRGSGAGIGPYGMGLRIHAASSYKAYQLTNMPYTTGAWVNITDIGSPYLIDNYITTYFTGVNTSSDCPGIQGHNEAFTSNSSYGEYGGTWITDPDGEYFVKLRYDPITWIGANNLVTGSINDTNRVDAYFVQFPRRGPTATYKIMLNRTGGTGNLNMRLIWSEDSFGDPYDTTENLADDTTGSTFPKYINHTAYYSVYNSGQFLLLVEPETPGVDIADYSIIYAANPPMWPSLFTAHGSEFTQPNVALDWTEDLEVTSYNIYREPNPISSVSGLTPIASVVPNNFDDVLPAYGVYNYVATGVTYFNESYPTANIQLAYAPLARPSSFSVAPSPTSIGDTINLNWSAVIGATSYKIFRDTVTITNVSLMTPIATTGSLGLVDNLPAPNTYYYVVQATNASGSGHLSTCQSVTYYTSTDTVLNAISPNPSYDGNIDLVWGSVTGASSYWIYKNTSLITTLTGLVPIYSTPLTYHTDYLPLESYGEYYYVVVATDGVHNSSMSNCEGVTYAPLPTPPPPTLQDISPNPSYTGNINLVWSTEPTANTYHVYRNMSYITNVSLLTPIHSTSLTYWTDNLPAAGYGDYFYVITASNSSGEGIISNCVNVTYPLVAPVLATIPINPTTTGVVQLTWSEVRGATAYKIYRSTTPILSVSGLTPINTVVSPTFTDYLNTEGTYYYAIVASTPAGDSPISNSAGVTYQISGGPNGPGGIPGPSPVLILGIISVYVGLFSLRNLKKKRAT